MNPVAVENENRTMLLKTADPLARALYDGARAGRSRKALLATMNEQLRSLRARCPTCGAEWPVLLLGREDARHICVVARRTSFLSLRRRLEEHCRKARLKCPSCAVSAQNLAAKEGPNAAEMGRREGGAVTEGAACTAMEA